MFYGLHSEEDDALLLDMGELGGDFYGQACAKPDYSTRLLARKLPLSKEGNCG